VVAARVRAADLQSRLAIAAIPHLSSRRLAYETVPPAGPATRAALQKAARSKLGQQGCPINRDIARIPNGIQAAFSCILLTKCRGVEALRKFCQDRLPVRT
jgi:hypothetical protein